MVEELFAQTSPIDAARSAASICVFWAPAEPTLDRNPVGPPEEKIGRFIIDLSAAGQARRRRDFFFRSERGSSASWFFREMFQRARRQINSFWAITTTIYFFSLFLHTPKPKTGAQDCLLKPRIPSHICASVCAKIMRKNASCEIKVGHGLRLFTEK